MTNKSKVLVGLEFVIHNPTVLSQKYWITNGACHSNYAVVFAQTYIKGKNEGIHTFLVRIRDEKMNLMPGVSLFRILSEIFKNFIRTFYKKIPLNLKKIFLRDFN